MSELTDWEQVKKEDEAENLRWKLALILAGIFIVPVLFIYWAISSGFFLLEATEWTGSCLQPLEKTKISASAPLLIIIVMSLITLITHLQDSD